MVRQLGLIAVLLMMLATPGAPAQAQNFDCKRLLGTIKPAMDARKYFSDHIEFNTEMRISSQGIGGKIGYKIDDVLEVGFQIGDKNNSCVLANIGFEHISIKKNGAPTHFKNLYNNKIVLFAIQQDQKKSIVERINQWKNEKYRINFTAGEYFFDRKYIGSAGYILNRDRFESNKLFGDKPSDVFVFLGDETRLREGGLPAKFAIGSSDGKIIVAMLCFPVSCRDLMKPLEQSSQSEEAQSANSATNVRGSGVSATTPSTATGTQDRGGSASAGAPPPAVAIQRFTLRERSGLEKDLAIGEFGNFACLLVALGAKFIDPRTPCAGPLFDLLRKERASVNVRPNGDWQIVPVGAPTKVKIRVPTGLDLSSCSLDVSYEASRGGSRRQGLDPNANSSEFTASFRDEPRIEDGRVAITVQNVGNRAECAVEKRTVVVEASGDVLEFDLVERPSATARVVYVPLANDSSLDAAKFDSSARGELGRVILEAIKSAHVRAKTTRSDVAWGLQSAEVFAVSQTNRPQSLVRMEKATLRQNPESQFVGARHAQLADSSRDQLNLASGSQISNLVRGLLPQGAIAGDRVVLVLIGNGVARVAPGSDICDSKVYGDVLADLAKSTSASLHLVVFPIVQAAAGRAVPLGRLDTAVSSSGWSTEMITCRSPDVRVTVHPFLADEWRSAAEIGFRFGSALSDRLGALVDDLVSSRELR
ncbi:hypothetical protein [Blastochloris sulfoviridis]|uniref:Uncharacterized protein n=1 Tax=Blastochloris sulfoviridis TaxID=50712 RepID=A0A5M6HRU0_9HYPH|nr:hypothetical protein [Blastochloris sulfoviridis]KAA5598219.1 hypothetical protein F1193_13610 [Blastochloris sulfoviridis]